MFVGFELIALIINATTTRNGDSHIIAVSHALLLVFLLVLAYLLHKRLWDHSSYAPLNIAVSLCFGVLIGEHESLHVAEFVFVLSSLTMFVICFVGVHRRIELQNTIASCEPVNELETQRSNY